MLVSGVQQGDSVIHIHVSILFQILFPFRLLHNTEQSSLCYTVGPCWLSILSISAVYFCLSPPPLCPEVWKLSHSSLPAQLALPVIMELVKKYWSLGEKGKINQWICTKWHPTQLDSPRGLFPLLPHPRPDPKSEAGAQQSDSTSPADVSSSVRTTSLSQRQTSLGEGGGWAGEKSESKVCFPSWEWPWKWLYLRVFFSGVLGWRALTLY